MIKKYTNKLFCFSPPVMLATFVIELALLFYTLWRYKLTPVSRLVMVMLACLATFQLAEYNVCESYGVDPMVWVRLGYVAITLLPPLGIHLIYTLLGKDNKRLITAAYSTAAVFIAFFVGAGQALGNPACLGNYVIFETAPYVGIWYGLYYYGWLLVGVWLSMVLAGRTKNSKIRQALHAFTIGYAAFILPTTAANLIDPQTLYGIPSIMCGFAVVFAIALIVGVLPNSVNPKR